jgi:predicted restriction endonuclease
MVTHRNWTSEEVWAALALYLRTEFGRVHKHNPDIIELGSKIGRTPSSVALKLSNLAALDETLDRKGMQNASKLDKLVWYEWRDNPDLILITLEQQQVIAVDLQPQNSGFGEGQDRFVRSKQRVGQSVFRDMILSSYKSRCALTGIDEPKLLNASHIVGWADDKTIRLDPHNGICLNALHDRAFDRHLLSFDENYRVILSNALPSVAREKLSEGMSVVLKMPDKFMPSQDYLEKHRKRFYDSQA